MTDWFSPLWLLPTSKDQDLAKCDGAGARGVRPFVPGRGRGRILHSVVKFKNTYAKLKYMKNNNQLILHSLHLFTKYLLLLCEKVFQK